MDWSGCELIELLSGTQSGQAFVKGTRIPADLLLEDIERGMTFDEIGKALPSVPVETLRLVFDYAVERLAWDEKTLVDWRGCKLVEQVPGRCSGAPTVVSSRIFPDTIAKYYWSGATLEEIREDYPSLSADTIVGLIGYVKAQEAHAA